MVGSLQLLPSRARLLFPIRRILSPCPSSTAFRAPAGGFPVDSRRQQRSIALSDIPPLPIIYGLEYLIGSRMYLVVVHPRLDARGRPLPRFPTSRSGVNVRVLRLLTAGPHPCGHLKAVPGFRAISCLPVATFPMVGARFLTPWPLVSDSHGNLTWRFRPNFPCSALFATPRCPFPVCHIPSLGHLPRLTPHPLFIPHWTASNPVVRAHWILIHLGTVLCVLHGSLLSHPSVFFFTRFPIPRGRCAVLGTVFSWPRPRIPSCYPCLYPTGPPTTHVYTPTSRTPPSGAGPRKPFLPLAMVAPIRTPAAFSLCVFFSGLPWVFPLCATRGMPQPPTPLCVSVPCS